MSGASGSKSLPRLYLIAISQLLAAEKKISFLLSEMRFLTLDAIFSGVAIHQSQH